MHPSLLARAKELDPADGEDLLQDAYVRFLEAKPRFLGAAQLKRWFRTTLRNLAVDRFRARPAEAEQDA